MKKTFSLIFFCIAIPFLTLAQKNKGNTISLSSSINFYPSLTPYTFFNSYNNRTNDELVLDFITNNSGTFVIEEGDDVLVNRSNINEFPTQTLGFGVSFRIMNEEFLFHEISLTKLSAVKSSHNIQFAFFDSDNEQLFWRNIGYEQKSSVFAFRYELGKYFGRKKRNKFRVGFSGGIEPSFYAYERKSLSIENYPIEAKIITLDFSLSPLFSFKLSKKLFLDIKPTTFVLVGQSNNVEENFPIAAPNDREGERELSNPELSFAFSVLLRYNLKEPSKGRRR